MIKKFKNSVKRADISFALKTKSKQMLRRVTYGSLFQELISYLVIFYLFFVYATSKKKFINKEVLLEVARKKDHLIIAWWHNRLMMIPFIARKIKESYPNYNFMALASKHGDGRFVARVVEKMGVMPILGSTRDHRKSSRGIDFANMRQIIQGLKKGYSFGITPDGPRGPNQKINGEIINIARLTKTKILAVSYSSSKFFVINSWDKLKIPLPFGKLCFYFDKDFIEVPSELGSKEAEDLKIIVEKRLDYIQEKSQDALC